MSDNSTYFVSLFERDGYLFNGKGLILFRMPEPFSFNK